MSDEQKARKRRPRAPLPPEEALEALWLEHGAKALRTVATYDPTAYIEAIARLVAEDDD